jgi:hypothetical protein
LRCRGPFSLASHGFFVSGGRCALADLVLGVLVLLTVIEHLCVVRLCKYLSPITEQDDAPILAPETSASVVKVKLVLIWAIMIELMADSRTPKLGFKGCQ